MQLPLPCQPFPKLPCVLFQTACDRVLEHQQHRCCTRPARSLARQRTLQPSLVTPTYLIRGTEECPGEITQHMQRALEESTSTNANSWRREATAMFKLNTFSELECTQCGHQTIMLNEPENLLLLAIEGRSCLCVC
jgi:hypothetical protein